MLRAVLQGPEEAFRGHRLRRPLRVGALWADQRVSSTRTWCVQMCREDWWGFEDRSVHAAPAGPQTHRWGGPGLLRGLSRLCLFSCF